MCVCVCHEFTNIHNTHSLYPFFAHRKPNKSYSPMFPLFYFCSFSRSFFFSSSSSYFTRSQETIRPQCITISAAMELPIRHIIIITTKCWCSFLSFSSLCLRCGMMVVMLASGSRILWRSFYPLKMKIMIKLKEERTLKKSLEKGDERQHI